MASRSGRIRMIDTRLYEETLTNALREANSEAKRVSLATEDGGTCNLDSLVLRLPKGMRAAIAQRAAHTAGVDCYERDWFGRAFFLSLDVRGQGNARVLGLEAAQKVLERHGIKTSYYAQMD